MEGRIDQATSAGRARGVAAFVEACRGTVPLSLLLHRRMTSFTQPVRGRGSAGHGEQDREGQGEDEAQHAAYLPRVSHPSKQVEVVERSDAHPQPLCRRHIAAL